MNIEFTVEDYFKELQLMEAQYGQEEELYPWIYMLLQMVESKKVQPGKKYAPISIRDVHKAEYANDEPLKKLLSLKQGPPDIAILNISSSQEPLCFLGCVEIKKIATPLEINIDETQFFPKTGKLIRKGLTLVYAFNPQSLANRLKKSCNNIEDQLKSTEKPFISQIDNPIIKKIKAELETLSECPNLSVNLKLQRNRSKQNGERTYGLRSYEAIFPLVPSNEEKFKDIEMQIDNQDIKFKLKPSKDSDWEYTNPKPYGWHEEKQIISHLEKFKKVLYTNGLEFYFLTLSEDEETIRVQKLADFSKFYRDYCDSDTFDLQSATLKWNNLIDGLKTINWHDKPFSKIN